MRVTMIIRLVYTGIYVIIKSTTPAVANYLWGCLLNGVVGLQSALDHCVKLGSTAWTCLLYESLL